MAKSAKKDSLLKTMKVDFVGSYLEVLEFSVA